MVKFFLSFFYFFFLFEKFLFLTYKIFKVLYFVVELFSDSYFYRYFGFVPFLNCSE